MQLRWPVTDRCMRGAERRTAGDRWSTPELLEREIAMSRSIKRTYFPQKTFDDDLDAFCRLAKSAGWSFSGVDVAQLERDTADQRAERARHEAAELEYNRLHEAFGVAQEARYARFADALNAARGAFRRDKAVLAQLDRFRRSARRAAQAAPLAAQ